MSRTKDNIITIGWAIKLALRINAGMFLLWGTLSIAAALLPAVALHFNRESVSILSAFLLTGQGEFADIVPSILTLGVILTVVGVSKRINGNFLYFLMYDSYYFGLEEYMMDIVQQVEIKTLMDKEYRDRHYTVMARCGALTDFMSSGLLFVSKLTGAISLLAVAAGTSLVVFGVSAVYVVGILLLNIFGADKLRWDNRTYQEARRLSDYYQDSVMSPGVAKELRVYDLRHEMLEKWDAAYERLDRLERKESLYRQIASFASGIGFYVFLVTMMGYCIGRVAAGSVTVDVFLMLYAMGQSLSDLMGAMSSGLLEADRGLYFLDLQRKFATEIPRKEQDWEEGFTPADEETVFQANNLCFSYDDQREVLHDLSFSIKKGETIALVGVNGSGKTTLVKLLIGLFRPTKGKLAFHGKPYDSHTRGAVIRRVGMFFQDFYIFHASLRENVGFGDLTNLNNDQRINLALEKGDAKGLLQRFPKGLEQWLMRNVKKDGAMLSGGERQRVAVSRAHMSDREILIFDEPAAALDPIAEMVQFNTIREKIAGRTAILISHRIGFARLADRIFVLDQGRLAQSGTHDQLIESGGVYADFFREQAQWYDTKAGDANE